MSGSPPTELPAKALSESDTELISAIFDDMATGFNARDAAHADQHFAADAVLVTPAGRRVEGLDALLRYHEYRFGGPASRWKTEYRVIRARRVDQRTAIVHTAQDVTTETGAFRNHGTFFS